ncbi:hypothetical protein MP638_004503 [Amoeboaphelidium occidentale]|nr:hypothetical protein MP638_004503 [Amoeboaphelidium occidentale]
MSACLLHIILFASAVWWPGVSSMRKIGSNQNLAGTSSQTPCGTSPSCPIMIPKRPAYQGKARGIDIRGGSPYSALTGDQDHTYFAGRVSNWNTLEDFPTEEESEDQAYTDYDVTSLGPAIQGENSIAVTGLFKEFAVKCKRGSCNFKHLEKLSTRYFLKNGLNDIEDWKPMLQNVKDLIYALMFFKTLPHEAAVAHAVTSLSHASLNINFMDQVETVILPLLIIKKTADVYSKLKTLIDERRIRIFMKKSKLRSLFGGVPAPFNLNDFSADPHLGNAEKVSVALSTIDDVSRGHFRSPEGKIFQVAEDLSNSIAAFTDGMPVNHIKVFVHVSTIVVETLKLAKFHNPEYIFTVTAKIIDIIECTGEECSVSNMHDKDAVNDKDLKVVEKPDEQMGDSGQSVDSVLNMEVDEY